MNTSDTIALEDRCQIPTYRKWPIAVDRGEGCWVWDADGDRYLDFYGGHCVALLGHSHPAVTAALAGQASELLFYSNAVYSPVRARAAAALAALAPPELQHVFFCNSGTEANETALKLARKSTGRSVMVAMEGGFHGRTLGSLSVTWGPGYRDPYESVMGPTLFVPFGDLEAVERVLADRSDVAAVILEPVQSMAGVFEAAPEYFRGLRKACDRAGCKLVFDEVQTGVGRTGTFSISESLGVRPDLITLAKSLGNGVPVGAVLVHDAIADGVRPGDQGTTFGGGMLAMAAVEAVLDVLQRDALMPRALGIEKRIRELLTTEVQAIRGQGALLGMDLGRPARPVLEALFARHVIAGGASDPNVVRIMPPLITPDDAIDEFAGALKAVLSESTAGV